MTFFSGATGPQVTSKDVRILVDHVDPDDANDRIYSIIPFQGEWQPPVPTTETGTRAHKREAGKIPVNVPFPTTISIAAATLEIDYDPKNIVHKLLRTYNESGEEFHIQEKITKNGADYVDIVYTVMLTEFNLSATESYTVTLTFTITKPDETTVTES